MSKLSLSVAAAIGLLALASFYFGTEGSSRDLAAASVTTPQQRRPSAQLGTVTVTSATVAPMAGDLFAVIVKVMPREACSEASITVATGPGLELVQGQRREPVALVPGAPIVRELLLRKVRDVDTSVIVAVNGESARRVGAWSYSGYQNFRMSEQLRQPTRTFTGANGVLLVGDR